MAASREDIVGWFKRGVKEGATHLVVVCDTYDYDDFPVYVQPGQDPHEVVKAHSGQNMERVMEVYNLGMDMKTQLDQHRSFNY